MAPRMYIQWKQQQCLRDQGPKGKQMASQTKESLKKDHLQRCEQ